jgi:hypothetical protein
MDFEPDGPRTLPEHQLAAGATPERARTTALAFGPRSNATARDHGSSIDSSISMTGMPSSIG